MLWGDWNILFHSINTEISRCGTQTRLLLPEIKQRKSWAFVKNLRKLFLASGRHLMPSFCAVKTIWVHVLNIVGTDRLWYNVPEWLYLFEHKILTQIISLTRDLRGMGYNILGFGHLLTWPGTIFIFLSNLIVPRLRKYWQWCTSSVGAVTGKIITFLYKLWYYKGKNLYRSGISLNTGGLQPNTSKKSF